MKKFFIYRQNNSGGSFEGPAVNVAVEADNLIQAGGLIADHFTLCSDTGMYSDYDSCGCCPCCGHRWGQPWDEEGESAEEALKDLQSEDLEYLGGIHSALIKSDGKIVVADSWEKKQEIERYLVAQSGEAA